MKYLRLIFFFFLMSCASSGTENKDIILFNNTSIELRSGDQIHEISPKVKETYLNVVSDSLQIPLFRYISNKDYDIYVGIPYNTSLRDIMLKGSNSINNRIETKTDSSTFFYSIEKIDSVSVIKYVRRLDKNMVSLIAITKSAYSDSLLSLQAISERIKINE